MKHFCRPPTREVFEQRVYELFEMKTDVKLIMQSYDLSAWAHRNEMRDDSITPYFVHPLETAWFFLTEQIVLDATFIAQNLLHDVIENNKTVSYGMLVENASASVADLVLAVSKKKEESADQYYIGLYLYEDWRVILSKLSDRLNNMRTLGNCTVAKQVRKSRETEIIFLASDGLIERLRDIVPHEYVCVVENIEEELRYLCSLAPLAA